MESRAPHASHGTVWRSRSPRTPPPASQDEAARPDRPLDHRDRSCSRSPIGMAILARISRSRAWVAMSNSLNWLKPAEVIVATSPPPKSTRVPGIRKRSVGSGPDRSQSPMTRKAASSSARSASCELQSIVVSRPRCRTAMRTAGMIVSSLRKRDVIGRLVIHTKGHPHHHHNSGGSVIHREPSVTEMDAIHTSSGRPDPITISVPRRIITDHGQLSRPFARRLNTIHSSRRWLGRSSDCHRRRRLRDATRLHQGCCREVRFFANVDMG